MIEIDGSQKSGSGTIVRDAVFLSVLAGERLRIWNIRAKRSKPGLRAQHLTAVQACVQICEGQVKGNKVGSREIEFVPGKRIKGGAYTWDIGTAGSTTMLALTVVPLALFASIPSKFKITGGLFQDFAPSVFHIQQVLLPLLERMGGRVDLKIIQPGYFPEGKGQIEVEVLPAAGKLNPLTLIDQGKIKDIKGIALSSLLNKRKVSERMARECTKTLRAKRYRPHIAVINDTKEKPAFQRVSVQAGASLAVWAATHTGCLLGSDMAGALGRPAEFIGRHTARNLLRDVETGATVDRHLADQIIPFAALAEGETQYLIPQTTDHILTRIWLMHKILGARTGIKENLIKIEGVGYQKK
ncbi:MAG: RNA 3'-terminal phosphate cyclase [Candidatus Aminicenantes bacterium]